MNIEMRIAATLAGTTVAGGIAGVVGGRSDSDLTKGAASLLGLGGLMGGVASMIAVRSTPGILGVSAAALGSVLAGRSIGDGSAGRTFGRVFDNDALDGLLERSGIGKPISDALPV